MNLKEIKKKVSTVQPFLTFKLFGVNQALAMPKDGKMIPMSVVVHPPTMTFIAESGFITSLITRYSKTYTESLRKEGGSKMQKQAAITKMMEEVKEGVFSSEEEQAKQLSLIVKLGKSYLIGKAIYAYYDDPKDTFKVTFTNDKASADVGNEDSGDEELYVYTDLVEDLELVNIGSELVSALPTTEIANIPFVEDTPNPETGKVEQEVTDSAPADKVAGFHRDLRSLAVEDVPPSGGKEPRDTRSDA